MRITMVATLCGQRCLEALFFVFGSIPSSKKVMDEEVDHQPSELPSDSGVAEYRFEMTFVCEAGVDPLNIVSLCSDLSAYTLLSDHGGFPNPGYFVGGVAARRLPLKYLR